MLWVAHTSKNSSIQARFKGFFTEWAQAKQKIPYVLMQEMRITPDLPEYGALLDKLFFELMDSKLGTVEEMKAYLEPHSPPAPPPPVHLRRARLAKKDAKSPKSRKKAAVVAAEGEPVGAIAAASGEVKTEPVEKPVKGAPAKAAAPSKTGAVPAKATEAKAAALAKGKVVAEGLDEEGDCRAEEGTAEQGCAGEECCGEESCKAKKAPVKAAAKKAASAEDACKALW